MILKERLIKLLRKDVEKSEEKKYHVYLIICLLCFLFFPLKNIWITYQVIATNGRLQKAEDWIYYAYKTKEKYTKFIKSRKIVIVAGSSALFGLSAEQIEKATGIPTVNFGVNAGLGIDYILWKVKPILNEGDIVILPLEYNHYVPTDKIRQFSSDPFRSYMISYDPKYLENLNPLYKALILLRPVSNQTPSLDLVSLTIKYIKDDLNALSGKPSKEEIKQELFKYFKAGKCYTGLSLNLNGDETCNIGNKNKVNFIGTVELNDSNKIGKGKEIQDFIKYSQDKKINLIPIYPGVKFEPKYLTREYQEYFQKISQFWSSKKIIFKDQIEDSFIPGDEMLNTYYHPTDQGRRVRTQKVIKLIKNSPYSEWINSQRK